MKKEDGELEELSTKEEAMKEMIKEGRVEKVQVEGEAKKRN